MLVEGLNASLLSTLQRPDLRIVAGRRRIVFDPALAPPFRVRADGAIALGPAALGSAREAALQLRAALEMSLLLADEDGTPTGLAPGLAWLAAVRVASRFRELDAPSPDADRGGPGRPDWLDPSMEGDAPPDEGQLRRVLAAGASRYGGGGALVLPGDGRAILAGAWDLLGPVELLLGAGGDARLHVDADTRLNHYGCSHRPRPWAVTYASSTASSLSERGFAGAEASRRRILCGALAGRARDALRDETDAVRAGIAAHAQVPDGTGIVLTASGTDCELLALAIAAMPDPGLDAPGRALLNILVAPEETGSGVPLASVGRHFASDTSRGAVVVKGAPIEGMPDDVRRADLAIRRADGGLIDAGAVDRAAEALVADGIAEGRHVLLHLLDVSKTGLLAPSIGAVARAARRGRGRVDVVVDACQARLTRARMRSYVEIGWMVLVTGSKFFTGPPFCGALLVPAAMMRRLAGPALPAGLADYTGRADWPDDAPAARRLPDAVNAGMVLRWQASLAEMRAFAAIPAGRKRAILETFVAAVHAAIDANPDLRRLPTPPLVRPVLADAQTGWDELQTIVPFVALDADRRPIALDPARRLYRWLNADVTACLPPGLGAQDRFLAALRCHVGQPAPLGTDPDCAGALRISAGARLVSGEPSHAGIGAEARLAREIADARACLDKLSLLLRHRDALEACDPAPSFGAPPEP